MTTRTTVPIGAAIPDLARWGLTSDADLVYRTLVTMGPHAASALATELGLAPRRVDAAIAELRAVGAISDLRTVWASRPPAEVIQELRHRRIRLADRTAQIRTHHAIVEGAVGRPNLGDGVRYLPSRAVTRRRLAELMATERVEHLAINTEQSFDTASAQAAAPLSRNVIERGVRMRVLGLPPADGDLHVDTSVFGHPFLGYREAPELPMKLLVIDRRYALFPADPADLERGYLEISQPGVVSALVMLFEHHWLAATDPREAGLPEIALDEREKELVGRLARGRTDVQAAAEMRISTRLVTKIMRNLMDRLGVENRFQLGLVLGAARATPVPLDISSEEN
ncbi:LuxR C-terminal-related transcriptional regulator [Actinoplanes sp. NPDC049265]|uniref:LuxR C-terminal-related transcriptional regulator n=1 Tax=Actinoplanes sp. NPDC049265 TaxID=3363902 RepID=UPI00370F9A9A